MTAPADPSSSTAEYPEEGDSPAPARLWESYQPPLDVYDELQNAARGIRPQWQMFMDLLADLGPSELLRRWKTARQLIHDNGVTYNVYGDPAGMDRPWNLDAIPFIISAEEWSGIESSLVQRAQLLNFILSDLYGPQRLLHEGLLPPQLIFGHRGFLRSLHGVNLPGNVWLHFYAADLGRASDGRLCVIGDRTQSPSGTGYALENRLVVSRALPDVFRDCRVQRLATFFRSFREALKSIAPHNKENPRIVLLTPGPFNETYFEHAYLARYLGFTLVEAGDLTVRDNCVFLKTLGGLQQVDVILRRQDDDYCDPLELRHDSSLGIAGLVQAVHSQNVAVANALGSGLLETPALMMFLPRLCRYFLGEELKMPSVNSYWCGDPAAQQYVLDNLSRMVIKPTFPTTSGGPRDPVFAETLSKENLAELRERIIESPADFVGEDQITLSTSPMLVDAHIEPRHLVLRAHLVATQVSPLESTSAPSPPVPYAVMPGGLTRFSASPDSLTVSMQRGGGSKDTWVLTAQGAPVDNFSMLPQPGQPVDISRSGGDLPSRVADNLYWLGRYMERAENTVRLARGITVRLTDQNFEASPEMQLLFATLMRSTDDPYAASGTAPQPAPPTEKRLGRLILDPRFPHGLRSNLSAIYRIAFLVRDRISADTWRIINRIDGDLPSSEVDHIQLSDLLPALDGLIITFAAFGGLAMESMTRGFAWRFLDMGRRIERALGTLNLLSGTLIPVLPRETSLLEAVLEIADSAMTYRRRYMTSLQAAPVLDLLMSDESNPRSIAFQLVRLTEHMDVLPRPGAGAHALSVWVPTLGTPGTGTAKRTSEEKILLRCLTALRLADMQTETKVTPMPSKAGARRDHLDDTLHSLAMHLLSLSDALSQTYLSHATATRQLGLLHGCTEGPLMPTYVIQHLTRYSYEDPVSVCHHLAHLLPRDTPHHTWRSAEVDITPAPAIRAERMDYFGNRLIFFAIQEPHRELSVFSQAKVELEIPPAPTLALFSSPPWEQARDQIARPQLSPATSGAMLAAMQFLESSPYINWNAEVAAYAAESFTPGRPIIEAAMELMARIQKEFAYDTKMTTVATTLPELMAARAGVCQDFAHLMIGMLRSQGLAARYVSGYLLTAPPPGKPRLVGADASHAWLSLYLPGHDGGAWLDLDPTNNLIPSDKHITLAWGRDFGDVSPIRGVILGGGRHGIQVNVDVAPG